MKIIIINSIVLLVFTVTNVNGDTLKGIVFNDENKNGFLFKNVLGI